MAATRVLSGVPAIACASRPEESFRQVIHRSNLVSRSLRVPKARFADLDSFLPAVAGEPPISPPIVDSHKMICQSLFMIFIDIIDRIMRSFTLKVGALHSNHFVAEDGLTYLI
jgi:hypothetical protein